MFCKILERLKFVLPKKTSKHERFASQQQPQCVIFGEDLHKTLLSLNNKCTLRIACMFVNVYVKWKMKNTEYINTIFPPN